MSLEVLNFALVLLGGCPRLECTQIAALAGFRIDLSRVQAVATRGKFPDHRTLRCKSTLLSAKDRRA
jgi:hypothetical protein